MSAGSDTGDFARVVDSKRFHAEDMELLLQELQQMCSSIQTRQQEIQCTTEGAEQERSQAQDRFSRAEQLQQAYEQMESAAAVLQQCEESAREMQELEQQVRIIAVPGRFRLFSTGAEQSENGGADRDGIEETGNTAAGAVAAGRGMCGDGKSCRGTQPAENSVYSQVSERVAQALKQFQKMTDTQKELEDQEKKTASGEAEHQSGTDTKGTAVRTDRRLEKAGDGKAGGTDTACTAGKSAEKRAAAEPGSERCKGIRRSMESSEENTVEGTAELSEGESGISAGA